MHMCTNTYGSRQAPLKSTQAKQRYSSSLSNKWNTFATGFAKNFLHICQGQKKSFCAEIPATLCLKEPCNACWLCMLHVNSLSYRYRLKKKYRNRCTGMGLVMWRIFKYRQTKNCPQLFSRASSFPFHLPNDVIGLDQSRKPIWARCGSLLFMIVWSL